MPLEEGNTPWFHFDPVLFLPLWIGIWRWAAYLILKGIPSLLYKPIPISEELEQGHVPVSTQMMTMIIPVYMPEPGFEECLQSWVDNRPKTIVIVVDTNSYQQVRGCSSLFTQNNRNNFTGSRTEYASHEMAESSQGVLPHTRRISPCTSSSQSPREERGIGQDVCASFLSSFCDYGVASASTGTYDM